MGSITSICNVAKRITKWHAAGYKLVVVASAMAGETSRLLNLAQQVSPDPSSRELDIIAATGEQCSSSLLAIALQAEGIPAKSYTGWQIPIHTDSAHGKARITSIDTQRLKKEVSSGCVVIVTGFQGVNKEGHITTLGRGGSDTSAVALAAALNAEECLIYTDVDGVYTTDPRIVPEASRMKVVSFEEMLEMSSLGSKVLQIRAVEFAGKYRIPTRVLSSFSDPLVPLEEERKSGTLITFEEDEKMETALISGIASNRDEAKVTLIGVDNKPGMAHAILGPIANAHIDVDMILQNQSVGSTTDFSFTVSRNELSHVVNVLESDKTFNTNKYQLLTDAKVAKISIVGIGMRSHVGVASLMFRTLSEEGINIQMISTSEIKISIIIDDKYVELAVRSLHKAFGLN